MTNTKNIDPVISSIIVTPGELKNTITWSIPTGTYGNSPVILTRFPPFSEGPVILPDALSHIDTDVEPGVEYLYNLCCMDSRGLQSAPIYDFGVPLDAADPEDPEDPEEPTDPVPGPSGSIYVSPTGDPNAPGVSTLSPTTVAHALAIVNPGETVVFLPGTYTATVPVATGTAVVNVTRSGTAALPINLFASSNVSIENPTGYGIYFKNVSHVVISGFEVQNCGLKGIAARESNPTAPMTGNKIIDCHIHHTTQEGIYLSQWSNGLIEDVEIDTVGLSGVETTGHGIYLANAGSKNVTFRRVYIRLTMSAIGAAIHMNGDTSSSAGTDGLVSGILIEDCRLFGGIKGVSGDGLTDSIIRNCIIDIQHSGPRFGHGIRAYQSDAANGPKNMQIYNNTIIAGTGGSSSAIRLTTEAGPQTAIFNNLTMSPDQYYFTGPSASNLNGTNFDTITYLPSALAQQGGVQTLTGISAPSHDINGVLRLGLPTIGAIE